MPHDPLFHKGEKSGRDVADVCSSTLALKRFCHLAREDVANEHRRQGKTSEEQGLKYYNFSTAIRQSGGRGERFGVNGDIFLP
jgi:hypothetical protein